MQHLYDVTLPPLLEAAKVIDTSWAHYVAVLALITWLGIFHMWNDVIAVS